MIMMFCLLLLLSEFMLQVIVHINPTLDQIISRKTPPPKIPDKALGYRPNPDFFEHDSNGFRNKTALSSSDIVAIGDSQTYGTGVKTREAWPHQLSMFSSQSVYNMSYGGYGSVEGLILLKTRAIKLNPKLVIFAMYDGNDIFDAYEAVYLLNLFESFKSADLNTRTSLSALEQRAPMIPEIKKIASQMSGTKQIQKEEVALPQTLKNTFFAQIKQLRLLQLFFCLENAIQKVAVNPRERKWKELAQSNDRDTNLLELFQTKNYMTIFTPAYRVLPMDLSDPRIEEGMRITLEAINEMKKIANDNSIEFLVLMIPLKERVFYEIYPENGLKPSLPMQRTISMQDKIRERTFKYLQQYEIPYIDTLPILSNCFGQSHQPFFEDSNGHLSPVGQKAIAEAVNKYIQNKTNQ